MTSTLGARKQPLIISIATAYVNDGIYDELYRRATAFLKGNSNETGYCHFVYYRQHKKWDTIEELKRAIQTWEFPFQRNLFEQQKLQIITF